jgi:hypothetical protein
LKNQKAIEENGKPLKKIEFLCEESWVLGEGKSQYFQEIL